MNSGARDSEAAAAAPLGIRALGRLEKRTRVAEAAQAVFREKGYEAAGMRLIAARAGVSIGTVFEFAKDKRSLLLLVFGRNLELCTQRAVATLDRNASLVDQLIHVYRERYNFFYDDINISLPLQREVSFFFPDDETQDPESPIAQYLEKRAAGRAHIVKIIEDQQTAGFVDAAYDARDIAAMVIAIHQVEMRDWLGKKHHSVAAGLERLRHILSLALMGVMTASRKSKES
jgi:AcrR family transcriptional regulator